MFNKDEVLKFIYVHQIIFAKKVKTSPLFLHLRSTTFLCRIKVLLLSSVMMLTIQQVMYIVVKLRRKSNPQRKSLNHTYYCNHIFFRQESHYPIRDTSNVLLEHSSHTCNHYFQQLIHL